MMATEKLPDDHDCEKCGCYSAEWGYHLSEGGYCLACGGCGDPECCSHDESCRFEIPEPSAAQ